VLSGKLGKGCDVRRKAGWFGIVAGGQNMAGTAFGCDIISSFPPIDYGNYEYATVLSACCVLHPHIDPVMCPRLLAVDATATRGRVLG
jgi:hypothetical protein